MWHLLQWTLKGFTHRSQQNLAHWSGLWIKLYKNNTATLDNWVTKSEKCRLVSSWFDILGWPTKWLQTILGCIQCTNGTDACTSELPAPFPHSVTCLLAIPSCNSLAFTWAGSVSKFNKELPFWLRKTYTHGTKSLGKAIFSFGKRYMLGSIPIQSYVAIITFNSFTEFSEPQFPPNPTSVKTPTFNGLIWSKPM